MKTKNCRSATRRVREIAEKKGRLMSKEKLLGSFLTGFAVLLLVGSGCGKAPYDLVILNGTLVDGTGAARREADVAVKEGKIVAIGELTDSPAERTLDAAGLIVAPGFIDIHNHSDYTILVDPQAESMVRQGVTTMVLGESGSAGPVVGKADAALPYGLTRTWTTLGGYFQHVENNGVTLNIGSYVGQGQVWVSVMGYENRRPTATELSQMKKLVAEAMEEGALGLSTSLLMPPWSLVSTDELVELAKVSRQYGGIYSTHHRDEGLGVFEAVGEAIEIGRRADIPVDIIHLKIAHKDLWGRMNELVKQIETARAEGLNIQANVYPYTAGQNNLVALIPPWALDGGRGKMLERLRDPALRRRMRQDLLNGIEGWYNHYTAPGGWDRMLLVSFTEPQNRPFQGKYMNELIESRGGDGFEVLFDVLLEEGGSVPTVYFHHTEPDMQLAMKQPWTSIGSDGEAVSIEGVLSEQNPHPRYYGTFPRVLGRYVRELGLLTLEQAVHKMTDLNARKVGFQGRGRVEEGYWADITLFDPKTVIDRATFEQSNQYPEGIEYVLVNGRVVLERGRHSGERPGKVLRGPGFKKGSS